MQLKESLLPKLGSILTLMLSFVTGLSNASEKAISFGTGYGCAEIVPIRLGFIKSWDKKWYQECEWLMGGYWELSAYQMNGKSGPRASSNNQTQALAMAGVLRFERAHPLSTFWPYVDLGFGLSHFNKREIGGRDLGMRFQFEDRLGFGLRFGDNRQFDISYRAIHFSNAHLGLINHGINLHVLVFGYWFD